MSDTAISQAEPWLAVWGFASTSSEVGILAVCQSEKEARDVATDFLGHQDNPAVGAWVRREEE